MTQITYAVTSQSLLHLKFRVRKTNRDLLSLHGLKQTSKFSTESGLDTRFQCWWIRHPQVMTIGQFEFLPLFWVGRICDQSLQVWAARIGSQRISPHLCEPMAHCLAATQSTYVVLHRIIQMIYTFLIAGGCKKLSDLKRIRTVSVLANTEASARKQLHGLPLVFFRQSPAIGNSQ